MITIRILAALSLITATPARTADRPVTPKAPATSAPTSLSTIAPQVPMLFIVDGVRYERGQQPPLSSDQIRAVRVIKGSAAIKRYGQDAAYGVVLIITRQAAGPRA
jgi:hypothetical protein